MKYLKIIVATFLIGVFVEMVLRVIWMPASKRYCGLLVVQDGTPIPKPNVKKMVYDSWTKTTYYAEQNSLGLRNEEIGEKRGYRILILGDSMTWGTGVNFSDTYSRKLENMMNAEVINAGVFGYNTIQERELLKKMIEYEPDLVIVGVLPANDLITNTQVLNQSEKIKYGINSPDYVTTSKEWRMDGDCIYHYDPKILASAKSFLTRKFYTFQYIREWMMKNNFGISTAMKIGMVTHNSNFFERDVYKKDYIKELDNYWLLMQDTLLEMKKISEENNSTFVILIIPQVDSIELKSFRMNSLLKEFGEENNITVIDPTEEFLVASENGIQLHYPIDMHLTPDAHTIIAYKLHEGLVK